MIRIRAQVISPQVMLSPQDQFHLQNVLRIKKNEIIEIIFHDHVYQARVADLNPLTITIEKKLDVDSELNFSLTLIYALSKGDKVDFVVQKATELGAEEVILIESERTIVHWQPHQTLDKFSRLSRIIHEATLQSKRTKIMTCQRLLSFDEACQLPFNQRYIASEYHQSGPTLLHVPFQAHAATAILVGCEGGWSEKEVAHAEAHHYIPVSLGKTLLRSETAAVTALSILQMRSLSR